MTYLDNNVTNVAIPTIQRSLHLSIAGLEWVVSSYVLVFAGLLLVGGRLADSYGRRRLFYIGTALFTVSSLAAGLAGSGGVLIAARLVQGLGAALLVPTTLAIIMATFTDARERTTAISAWTAIGAMALAFGPLIGGFISQHFHWGWIFFINVPVGIIAMVIAAVTMNESKDDSAAGRLDLPGMLTSSLALFSLTYALIEGHDKGWTSGLILGAFVLAAIAGAAFILIESRTEHPMVPLSLFRNRVYSGGGGLALMSTLGAGASFAALMPGFVIFGLGAGLMQVPLTNAILDSQPAANAGIASALLNAAREVSGLLGITVIGAVLRATQSGALNRGTTPAGAFLDGYHAGLYVTVGLLVAGAVLSYLALRGVKATAPVQVPPAAEPERELAGAAQH